MTTLWEIAETIRAEDAALLGETKRADVKTAPADRPANPATSRDRVDSCYFSKKAPRPRLSPFSFSAHGDRFTPGLP